MADCLPASRRSGHPSRCGTIAAMTDDVTQLIELGSRLLFAEMDVDGLPSLAATVANDVVVGALPLAALPVIASISAIAHPKDYRMRPVKTAATALRGTAAGDELAVIEVLALTVGKQLFSSVTLDDERELLGTFRDRGARFQATASAFDALGAGEEEALALLSARVEETRSPSLVWLEEACARVRRDRRRARALRALLDTGLAAFQCGPMLGPHIAAAREHVGDRLPPWDARKQTLTSIHGFMHDVLMAYRRLRGLELLAEWLPALARAIAKGSA